MFQYLNKIIRKMGGGDFKYLNVWFCTNMLITFYQPIVNYQQITEVNSYEMSKASHQKFSMAGRWMFTTKSPQLWLTKDKIEV